MGPLFASIYFVMKSSGDGFEEPWKKDFGIIIAYYNTHYSMTLVVKCEVTKYSKIPFKVNYRALSIYCSILPKYHLWLNETKK